MGAQVARQRERLRTITAIGTAVGAGFRAPAAAMAPYEVECKALGYEVRKRIAIHMTLEHQLMRALVLLFFTGLAGSAIVVVISFIEDSKELAGKD
jgi:hypothetical protein